MVRARRVVLPLLIPVVAAVAVASAPAGQSAEPYGSPDVQLFRAGSWWNTPLPAGAPRHTRSDALLTYLRTADQAGGGCLRLAGAGTNPWGQPVYWARSGDPVYDVRTSMARRPAELASLRIPASAAAAATSDAAMTVFDRQKGHVVALSGAAYNRTSRTWSARGATVTYLASNGLHVKTGRSDDARNLGSHRGNNGATMMVRHDEVAAGAINHVLKIASGPEVSTRAVFPMVNSDGDSTSSAAPPQGLRLRLKPSVNLDAMRLDPAARVIARALQTHGVYIGDSGGTTALKLENTRAEGRGQLWTVRPDALCSLPFTSALWDVLPEGYSPSR